MITCPSIRTIAPAWQRVVLRVDLGRRAWRRESSDPDEAGAAGVCHVHLWSRLTGRWVVTAAKHTVPVGATAAELEALVYHCLPPPPPPRRRLAFAVQGEAVASTLHVRPTFPLRAFSTVAWKAPAFKPPQCNATRVVSYQL